MIGEETCASHALSNAKIMPDFSKYTPHPEWGGRGAASWVHRQCAPLASFAILYQRCFVGAGHAKEILPNLACPTWNMRTLD
jgi:hypothetical protein